MFYSSKWGYDQCRKRLVLLQQRGYIKRYKSMNDEYVYYCTNDNLNRSEHDIYVYNFYSKLISNGYKINHFKFGPFIGEKFEIPSDGLFVVEYVRKNKSYRKLFILEVDFGHKTGEEKINKYVTLYSNENFYKEYNLNKGDFPILVIMGASPVHFEAPFKIVNIYFNLIESDMQKAGLFY